MLQSSKPVRSSAFTRLTKAWYLSLMPTPQYRWRALTPEQQVDLLEWRKAHGYPWHSPPHRPNFGHQRFHITAACFEHQPFIGHSLERMDGFLRELLKLLNTHARQSFAWCVLPNHYHLLVEAPNILGLLHELGKLHGACSYRWNGEENTRGRKVFFRTTERAMRSDGHYWATLNYIHHNPVHHRYVDRWEDWRWSSASAYLAQNTPADVESIWAAYPISDYGKGWDDPDM